MVVAWRGAVKNAEQGRRVEQPLGFSKRMSRIAILMYHGIEGGADAARFTLSVRQFERQMRWLRNSGRHLVSLEDVVRTIRAEGTIAGGAVAVTFDDGHESFYDHALPVLEELAIPATMFVVAGKLGGHDDWMPPELPRKPLMTAEQVQDLPARGVAVGSHSMTHARLTELDDVALRGELVDSRVRLTKVLGREVDLLAYPYGLYDEGVVRAARAAGYTSACSTRSGFNTAGTDVYALRRIDVYGTDSFSSFRHKLELGVNDGSVRARTNYYGARIWNMVRRLGRPSPRA
jgi:peptidoglycan/xylan/chitin deacetylase (PgdA/CDA1 family)